MVQVEKVILDEDDVRRTIARMSHEIDERAGGAEVGIVGVHRRGAVLSHRIAERLRSLGRDDLPLGEIDISFYRDDFGLRGPSAAPVVHASRIEFPLEGMTIVLVDDVLYTGRTVRAAIDALFDYGRPQRVQLAVLVDRGHRELPIRPDYVGKNLPTARGERVNVRLVEIDGVDEVTIANAAGPGDSSPEQRAFANEEEAQGA
jgi:pyrimidine operon attenuation protein / uracil phosphoribosyltransferase